MPVVKQTVRKPGYEIPDNAGKPPEAKHYYFDFAGRKVIKVDIPSYHALDPVTKEPMYALNPQNERVPLISANLYVACADLDQGRGVYADQDIEKGQFITFYHCRVGTADELMHLAPEEQAVALSTGMYGGAEGCVVYGRDRVKLGSDPENWYNGPGAIINTPFNPQNANCVLMCIPKGWHPDSEILEVPLRDAENPTHKTVPTGRTTRKKTTTSAEFTELPVKYVSVGIFAKREISRYEQLYWFYHLKPHHFTVKVYIKMDPEYEEKTEPEQMLVKLPRCGKEVSFTVVPATEKEIKLTNDMRYWIDHERDKKVSRPAPIRPMGESSQALPVVEPPAPLVKEVVSEEKWANIQRTLGDLLDQGEFDCYLDNGNTERYDCPEGQQVEFDEKSKDSADEEEDGEAEEEEDDEADEEEEDEADEEADQVDAPPAEPTSRKRQREEDALPSKTTSFQRKRVWTCAFDLSE